MLFYVWITVLRPTGHLNVSIACISNLFATCYFCYVLLIYTNIYFCIGTSSIFSEQVYNAAINMVFLYMLILL